MNTQQPTCEQRWASHRDSRIEDLRRLWDAYCGRPTECPDCEGEAAECETCDGLGEIAPDQDGNVEDLGNIFEYGLSFDYVAPGTFGDQEQGYFRYQLSWGGPSDEFRYYVNPDLTCYRVEYWFLDWWDGHGCALYGDDRALLMELWGWFEECGSAQAELDKAQE
jgi:hypothetical protein